MIDRLFGLFSHDLGIDLGTANTLMMIPGKGLVVKEPTVVARHVKTQAVIAVGSEAKRMIGKTPVMIEVVRPLKDGVIADFDAAEAMLAYYIREVHGGNGNKWLPRIPRPRVVVGVPSGITEVEGRAVQDAAISAGAREAILVEEPMAAAIGVGLKVEEPEGRMIVDIGGGTTEIAVVSLGGIVLNRSIRVAGDELDEAVITFARMKYGLVIGQPTAEDVKIAIGSAMEAEIKKSMSKSTNKKRDKKESGIKGVEEVLNEAGREKADTGPLYTVVRGRDMASGLPKSVKFNSIEVREALSGVVRQIINAVVDTIEETPPELVADILDHGIVLAGGGSNLRGLERLVSEETKIPVWRAAEPHMAVVKGAAAVMTNPKLLDRVKVVGGIK